MVCRALAIYEQREGEEPRTHALSQEVWETGRNAKARCPDPYGEWSEEPIRGEPSRYIPLVASLRLVLLTRYT